MKYIKMSIILSFIASIMPDIDYRITYGVLLLAYVLAYFGLKKEACKSANLQAKANYNNNITHKRGVVKWN